MGDTLLLPANVQTAEETMETIRTHEQRQVHVLVEVFGGRFLLQKGRDGKWNSGAFGNVGLNESVATAAIRALKKDLGLSARPTELREISMIGPSKESDNKPVTLFSYLMNPEKEALKLDVGKVNEAVMDKLMAIVEDVKEHRDEYSPIFVQVFNIFLALERKI
jgi:predicted NUDIX family NTP pyrophosphohydrolase